MSTSQVNNAKVENPNIVDKPWGAYMVIESAENYKVKWIDVLPGRRLSLQSHEFALNIGLLFPVRKRLRERERSLRFHRGCMCTSPAG